MANELRDHVWFIDTAAATVVSGTEELRIKSIRFIPATNADVAVLKNGDGKTVWETTAGGSTLPEESRLDLRCAKGFIVSTLTAGAKLYLYGNLDGPSGR